jgi:hypothetical protein
VVTHAPGAAAEIADVFFESPDIRAINLIGGVKTAKMPAKRAGETLKHTTMELGGFNPMIILDDVDMDYAVRTATFGSFFPVSPGEKAAKALGLTVPPDAARLRRRVDRVRVLFAALHESGCGTFASFVAASELVSNWGC